MTYAAPLKVTIRLTVYSKDPDTGVKSVRDIKEQEVFFGEIPLMTENGTFIINGTERVIVSQLHRSPGVFFERVPAQGYFLGKIIPYRGSWVEFEYDVKNLLYVRIDRKRKFYGSVFLRALGLKTDEQILRTFYRVSKIEFKDGKLYWNALDADGKLDKNLEGLKLSYAILNKAGDTIVAQGKKITPSLKREIEKHKTAVVEVAANDLEGAFIAADVVDMNTGEVMVDSNNELTPTKISTLIDNGIPSIDVFFPERDDVGTVISATLRKDPVKIEKDALIEIYRKLRPGDPPTVDTATQLFQGMFFDHRKYDFSRVGRMKFNIKLHDKADATPLDNRTLTQKDFIDTITYLLKLRKGQGRRRRYRSFGKSPRSCGGRAPREPVPDRSGPHGAGNQGKNERLPGDVDGDAARSGERQAGNGGDSRIFRIEPALAVHGSDQSAVRDHAQAPAFGPWTGRSVAGAGRLRSARCASHALRPDLPDRDSGRPEHRPDFLSLLLCADQRLRVYRKSVPACGGRHGGGRSPRV